MTSDEFRKIYWAHQHPDVRKLYDLQVNTPNVQQAAALAIELAGQGHLIDSDTMIEWMDPLTTMQIRKRLGYTWVTSLLMDPVQTAPGIVTGGFPPYDPNKPPKGSIKVSVDPSDYPPFDPPVDPVKKPTVLVGAEIYPGTGRYHGVPGDDSPNGASYADARGNFRKVLFATPFGNSMWWQKL